MLLAFAFTLALSSLPLIQCGNSHVQADSYCYALHVITGLNTGCTSHVFPRTPQEQGSTTFQGYFTCNCSVLCFQRITTPVVSSTSVFVMTLVDEQTQHCCTIITSLCGARSDTLVASFGPFVSEERPVCRWYVVSGLLTTVPRIECRFRSHRQRHPIVMGHIRRTFSETFSSVLGGVLSVTLAVRPAAPHSRHQAIIGTFRSEHSHDTTMTLMSRYGCGASPRAGRPPVYHT